MRRQLSTTKRCWTTHIFKRCFKNHPPITFKQSVDIIEQLHFEMMDFMMKTSRPIEIKRTIGYLYLNKNKTSRESMIINWKKTREKGKLVRELNHHTNGYAWAMRFRFYSQRRLGYFIFKPLKKHKEELARRIKNKIIQ